MTPFLFPHERTRAEQVPSPLIPAPSTDAGALVKSPAYAPLLTPFQAGARRSRLAPPNGGVVENVSIEANGELHIDGAPVALDGIVSELIRTPPYQESEGQYGDMRMRTFILAANQVILALPRPTYKRLLVQIQNKGGANDVNYSFGTPASPDSLAVGPMGSSDYMQAVPQNELWLMSVAGTTVTVAFIDDATADRAPNLRYVSPIPAWINPS